MRGILHIFITILGLLIVSCNGSILEDLSESKSSGLSVEERGIWLVGGLSGSAITSTVAQIDLYDPVTDTWYPDYAVGASGTYVPVSFASVTGFEGKIYVIGGFDSGGNVSNLVQIFDIETNSWSSGTSTGFTAVANVGSFVWDGKIIILAGTTGLAGAGYVRTNANQIYNINGNNWSTGIAVYQSSSRYGAVLNGVVYHGGGRYNNATTLTNTHDGYVIATNTLTGVTEIVLPSARYGQTMAIYTKDLYRTVMIMIGGFIAPITGTTGNFVFQGTTATTPQNTTAYLDYPFGEASPIVWTDFTYPYPVPHGFSTVIIYGDEIIVFGGATSHSSGGITSAYKNDLSGFPGSKWTAISAMPVGRFGHGAVMFNHE